MATYRQAPTYEVPITTGKNTTPTWYRWVQSIDTGVPPSTETVITVGASPFTYTAPSGGFVIIDGGSVTTVQFVRVGSYYTGVVNGLFPLSLGDKLIVTYAVAPTVFTFVPQ
jgi:hypothetical protein